MVLIVLKVQQDLVDRQGLSLRVHLGHLLDQVVQKVQVVHWVQVVRLHLLVLVSLVVLVYHLNQVDQRVLEVLVLQLLHENRVDQRVH